VPVINEIENQLTAATATFISNTLSRIEDYGNEMLPNSNDQHWFRCPQCKREKYVSTLFREFLNFPVCIKCAQQSFQKHR
jgi:hypothetical protein